MDIAELEEKSDDELLDIARELGAFENGARPRRRSLMVKILQAHAEKNGDLQVSGVLSVTNDGYGFLKPQGQVSNGSDVYVSQSQIRRFSLRAGDQVSGQIRPPKEGERYFGLVRVESVNGLDPEQVRNRPHFEKLTPIFPMEQIKLETTKKGLSTRLVDMIAPIGRGQRGLIVSPPKAGKTTFLKQIANGITANSPDIQLMVALIGERPEEVTDMTLSLIHI